MENKDQKYIVTISQLAKIVSYCVGMTIVGSGVSKDWTKNVKTAIGIYGWKYYGMEKIKLEKYEEK